MSRIFVILLERGPIESLNMNRDGHFLFGSEDFWAICIMNLTREAFVSGSINGKAGSRFAPLTRLTPRSFPLPLPVFCASRGKFSGWRLGKSLLLFWKLLFWIFLEFKRCLWISFYLNYNFSIFTLFDKNLWSKFGSIWKLFSKIIFQIKKNV